MDLAATHIKETATELKHQTDKMEERLKSDSFNLYEEPLYIRKGVNIQGADTYNIVSSYPLWNGYEVY